MAKSVTKSIVCRSHVADNGELVKQSLRLFGFFADAVDDAHEHGCKGTPSFAVPPYINPQRPRIS